MATLASLMVDPPPVPRRAGVLRPVLEALLKKDPSQRADANETERLLRDAANGVPAPRPIEAPRPHANSRRRVLLMAAGVAILAAASAAFVLTNRGPNDAKAVPPNAISSITNPEPAEAGPSSTPATKPSGPTTPASRPPSAVAPSITSVTTRPPTTKAVKAATTTRTLTSAFNNVGVTDDAHTTAGNFDGGGATYSKQAFAAGGTTPGKTLTVGGVPLTWPSTAGTGRKDNAIAAGQTIAVPGSGTRLAFLLASDYGAISANGRITYTDGSTQAYTLAAPDWFDTGDPSAAAVSTYQNRSGDDPFDEPAAVFGATVTLTGGKTVASVRLPTVGAVPAREGTTTLHIFAARIG
jgi:hypothetical protein